MLLEVNDLEVTYPGRRHWMGAGRPVRAVNGVSFTIDRGETLALVGESGSGKTTTARAIAGLVGSANGSITFDDLAVENLPISRRKTDLKRAVQYVFQNPDASLNPRRRISYSLGRTLEHFFDVRGPEKDRRVCELLESVRLDPSFRHRFPGQLSGGERQRVAIARALAAQPKLIICDEIVTALDVSVQASILDLLREVRERLGVSYLFIAHDLAVVRWLADNVVVLYGGAPMESGQVEAVFRSPSHPYTESLLSAVPSPHPDGSLLATAVAAHAGEPAVAGCAFHTRCDYVVDGLCDTVRPPTSSSAGIDKTMWCHVDMVELGRYQAETAS